MISKLLNANWYQFSVKAQRFDDFLHMALNSKKLNRDLVRFVSI
jgi:hypothetical protein